MIRLYAKPTSRQTRGISEGFAFLAPLSRASKFDRQLPHITLGAHDSSWSPIFISSLYAIYMQSITLHLSHVNAVRPT